MGAEGVVGSILVAIAAIYAALQTRRTSREANAVTGFKELMAAHESDMKALRLERGEDRARIADLERTIARQRVLNRAHERWDWALIRTVRNLSDDPIPDPPPLDATEIAETR